MIQTVEELTDVRIDHFAVTDFDSFSTMTDALGGVRITLNSPLSVPGRTLDAGEQRLNGEQALSYVRQRYGLSGETSLVCSANRTGCAPSCVKYSIRIS